MEGSVRFLVEKIKGETKAEAWIEAIAEYDSKTGRAVVGVARNEPVVSEGGVWVRRGWELWDTKREKKIQGLTEPKRSFSFHRAIAPKLPKAKETNKTKEGEQDGARKPATAADSDSEGNDETKPESEGRSL